MRGQLVLFSLSHLTSVGSKILGWLYVKRLVLYVKRARVFWTKYLSISFFLQSIFVMSLKSTTFLGYILSTRLIIISFCYAFSGSVSSLVKSSPRANNFARYSQRGDVGYKRGRARFHILVRTKWLITFKKEQSFGSMPASTITDARDFIENV